MFTRFASLIAVALHNQDLRDGALATLTDERATSELREQFIAILRHDLRNPLQAVAASSEMLIRKPNDPDLLQKLAGCIKTNVKRMSSSMSMRDWKPWSRNFRTTSPTVKRVSSINVTRQVRCDLGRVQQRASNLIGNALTHGAPDSPVRMTAYADDAELILEVWNNGDPIPPESISKIFEPFWRAGTSAMRNRSVESFAPQSIEDVQV